MNWVLTAADLDTGDRDTQVDHFYYIYRTIRGANITTVFLIELCSP